MQYFFQFAVSHPLLEAAMASLVRGIFLWQFAPLRPCTQDPQDSIEHGSRILPGTTATIGAAFGAQYRFDKFPLGIADFPSSSHALLLTQFIRSENS
jgi:hypothetical protein